MNGFEPSASLKDRITARKEETKVARSGLKLNVGDGDEHNNIVALLVPPADSPKGVKGGRIAFFIQEGKLTVCLSYPWANAVAFKTLEAFKDAFYLIEGWLASDDLTWRENEANSSTNGKAKN